MESGSVEHIQASPVPSHRGADGSDSGLYSSSFGTVTDVSPAAGYDTVWSASGAENKDVSLPTQPVHMYSRCSSQRKWHLQDKETCEIGHNDTAG